MKLKDLAWKSTYPVLGNLSWNLQRRLMDVSGGEDDRKNYNPEDATIFSSILNLGAYPLAIGFINYFQLEGLVNNPGPEAALMALFGEAYAICELSIRNENSGFDTSCASLPGKIVSIPFDLASYAWDKYKGPRR